MLGFNIYYNTHLFPDAAHVILYTTNRDLGAEAWSLVPSSAMTAAAVSGLSSQDILSGPAMQPWIQGSLRFKEKPRLATSKQNCYSPSLINSYTFETKTPHPKWVE